MTDKKSCTASIIVCTKNRPDDLERCSNSLKINMDHNNFEVLVVDDLFASISVKKQSRGAQDTVICRTMVMDKGMRKY